MRTKVTANLLTLGLAVAAILAVGLAAFRLSFVGLRELAVAAGIPAGDAWLFPVVIDITTAIAAALALAATDDDVRQWFSRVLIVGTVVSIAGNALHAVLRGQLLPTWGCVLVVSVAPIAVFADVHGLILLIASMTSIPRPAPADSSPAQAVVPVSAPPAPVYVDEPIPLEAAPADPPMVAVSVAVSPPPRPAPVRPMPVQMPIARPIVPVSRP
ncbi:DUF2637 domain-containing protein [Nocardia sp. NPDC056611]|uniref:DUF2637 domain-containing protein n=1 Tax=Nocardia sp. NPDC056611 TaxID=3345877 RepID=UPI00366E23C9